MHLIAYTDGGCRPKSRGFAGSGLHAYTAIADTPKQGAGAKQTPTMTGYSADKTKACTVVNYYDWWQGLPGEQTNNVAELVGFAKAMELAISLNVETVYIYTDSEYVEVNFKKNLDNWVKRNWQASTGPVKNVNYWKAIHALRDTLESLNIKLVVTWVKAHDVSLGNNTADAAATRGVVLAMKGETDDADVVVSEPKGYWSNKSTYNRFLSKTRLYFNTHSPTIKTASGNYVYYLGKHGPDDSLIGKRVSDVSFSVVHLKEPDDVIESLVAFQSELRKDENITLAVAKLDAITNPNTYAEIAKYGSRYLQKDLYDNNIVTPGKVTLTVELDPPRIAQNAVDTLNELHDVLTTISEVEFKDTSNYMVTDITGMFYEEGKLLKSISQSIKHVDLMVRHDTKRGTNPIKQRFLLDMDLPSRNALSALASSDTRVYAVTWLESSDSFRFASVVVADGEMGIWSTAYSNLRIVK